MKTTARWRVLTTAIFVIAAASSGAQAQTSSVLDRSEPARQTTVDPVSGTVLGVPDTYPRVRADDRSDLAQQMDVDSSTGEILRVPDSFKSPGALDRAHLAQETAVDALGLVTAVPQSYPDARAFDRSALVQQMVVDTDTGQISDVPASYADVGASNRSAQASQTQVAFATGEIHVVPVLYPPDFDADGLLDPSDNCPFFTNPDQADTNVNGRGNACECSDQNLTGSVNVSDLVAINFAIFDPALVTPLCDGNNDGLCNVSDIVAGNRTIFVPKSSICERQPVPGP